MIVEEISQIEFELTSRCNAECPLCPRTVLHNRPDKHLPIYDINFDSMKEWMPKEFNDRVDFKLSGNIGDAGTHPKCDEIIKFLGSYGKRSSIKLHTNGGMRSESFWKELGEISYHGQRQKGDQNKFNFAVRFAIDGLEDTNHLYRIGTRWDTIMRNVEAYINAGGKAEWHFIEFDHNYHQVEEARKLSESMGVRFVQRLSVRNQNLKNASSHKHVNAFKHAKKAVTAWRAGQRSTYITNYINMLTKSVHCQHLINKEVYVASNETLWPCCMLWNDYISNGNRTSWPEDETWNSLQHHDMQKILNSKWYTSLEKYWKLKNKNFTPECLARCGNQGKFKTKFAGKEK